MRKEVSPARRMGIGPFLILINLKDPSLAPIVPKSIR